MPRNVVIYGRTSPNCPLPAAVQVEQLTRVANERGWTVVATFTDRPAYLRKGRDRRRGETALIDMIRRGDVQRVLLWDIDRIARSLTDLVSFLEICRTAGVSLWLHQQKLDTEIDGKMSLFDFAEMLAHYLRQSRRERILLGLAAAKVISIKLGRPRLPEYKIKRAKEGLAAGEPLRQVARVAGMSAASVCRLKASMERSAAEIVPQSVPLLSAGPLS